MTDRLVRPDRTFFSPPALEVAPLLLGAHIRCGGVEVRLTEVEAYEGGDDPGSHAFRGPTPRTEVMFGPAGHLYVYFSYGAHWAANIVCGTEGRASAVLLRAGEVVAGEQEARTRRDARRRSPAPVRDLARGPGNLGSALGLGRGHTGLDLFAAGSPVTVRVPVKPRPADRVGRGPRVGVSGPGGDGQLFPWRFWLVGEPTVSAYRTGADRERTRPPLR